MARPAHVQKFIEDVAWQAQAVARESGFPASVIVAQSGIESGWGKRVKGNAYFGVKANTKFHECVAKIKFKTKEATKALSGSHSFCAYKSYMDAAVDYAKFIKSEPQFKAAVKHRRHPIRYAELVADGGYAGGTSKAHREGYKRLLLQIMRQFKLGELDSQIWLKPVVIRGD